MEEQEQALRAAKFSLERELGDSLHEVATPDLEIRDREAVDLVLAGRVGRIALEHTRLEPRPRLIGDKAELSRFFTLIIERLQGRLPSGCFQLHVPPAAVSGLTGSKATKAQKRVAEWIADEAAHLEIGSPSTAPRHWIAAGPPEIPFPAGLFRWPASEYCPDGSLQLIWSPEPAVAEALSHAILSRAGKLAEAPGTDVRALVLQDVDVQLSDASVTSQTLSNEWEHLVRTNSSLRLIDWIILVSLLEQPIVYVLKDPGGPLGAEMRWSTMETGS